MLVTQVFCRQMLGRAWIWALAAAMIIAGMPAASAPVVSGKDNERGVRIVPKPAERRVDVYIDGQLFTAYLWPETVKKPILYPLRTDKGTAVTRGFPLETRPGEREDHPHQIGLWFNFGDVNGVDFWGNSASIKPELQARRGTIHHREITRVKNGKQSGELTVTMDWVMPDAKTILREETTFVFQAGPNLRGIDRITRLTALDARVVFTDNKEGMLGLRVRRELEHPNATTRPNAPKLDNTGVTGSYLSSEGIKGDAVWGTRARWMTLSGTVEGGPVTAVILDHPRNPGHPTYWHARGYGLFAANPLGQKFFSQGKEELNLALEPKQSVTFRHRLLIVSSPLTPDQVESQYRRFAADSKTLSSR